MKRIIIICEGQTEQQFCNDVLQKHFNQKGIFIQFPIIQKTGGGITNWEALKYQVELLLKQNSTAFVTTLIDFYGIHANHKYPNWEIATNNKVHKDAGIDLMEKGMLDDINEKFQFRFIPYIQLHEFEALLFSDIQVFKNNFESNEFSDFKYLEQTINENPNPEMINDNTETAPSKRLAKIVNGYSKVAYGSLIANEIGINKIREKCPRFNHWISILEKI